MAVITSEQAAKLRQAIASGEASVPWSKSTVNAAYQAIEDTFEGARPVLGAAIETAAPGVFTNPQKVRLVKHWLKHKLGVS